MPFILPNAGTMSSLTGNSLINHIVQNVHRLNCDYISARHNRGVNPNYSCFFVKGTSSVEIVEYLSWLYSQSLTSESIVETQQTYPLKLHKWRQAQRKD